MVRTLLQLLFVLVICLAFLRLFDMLAGYESTTFTKKSNVQKQKSKKARVAIHEIPFVRKIITFLARYVYMEKTKEAAKAEQLARAGIRLTPKEYIARAALGVIVGLFVVLWGKAAHISSFTFLGLLLGFVLGGYSLDEVNRILKDKDVEVAKELPKFVSTIVASLRSNKNIIRVIQSYMKDAKPALKSDLEMLVLEMNTGNIEDALRRFEIRMGSPEISRLVTSLVYIENGIDQTTALEYLESDMRLKQHELRREELAKLPGKMRKTFIPVGIVLIVIFFYTVMFQILNTFSTFI